jgi:hypothetical protein
MLLRTNNRPDKISHIFVLALLIAFSACGGGGSSSSGSGPTSVQANRAPAIVSASEAVFPQTRTGVAYTIVGSDPDGDALTYSIAGPDAGAFSVEASTGALTFVTAPNVDRPGAADGSNFYVIEVRVADSSGASASQRVDIEVSRHDPEGPSLFRDGAVFLAPDTITENDPTALLNVTFFANGTRNIPDNRVQNDVDTLVNIFTASFTGGKQITVMVNAEILFSQAEIEANRYARIVGQLDPIVREEIDVLWIHAGDATFSGNPGGIVIHTGRANQSLVPQGFLEETMAHESVHATLDALYLQSQEWFDAQRRDVTFPTDFAREFPETEDLAESYGAYLIVQNAERNPPDLVNRIRDGIPARLQFFADLGL